MNLINHIGNYVTVWTVEGNSMDARKLITADEFGVVVAPWPGDPRVDKKEVFVPWGRVKYIDLIKPREELKMPWTVDTSKLEKIKQELKDAANAPGHLEVMPEESQEGDAILDYPTSELVDMLAKREGVNEYVVPPYRKYAVDNDKCGEINTGPARILVIRD